MEDSWFCVNCGDDFKGKGNGYGDTCPKCLTWVPNLANKDIVKRPCHYQIKDGFEVRDVQAWATEGLSGMECVLISNAIKYLLRCTRKGNKTQDIEKALDNLEYWKENKDVEVR